MSDGKEVMRWWTRGQYDNDTEVVSAKYHDRIMSERDELWKRATKFVMPGEMDTGESIEHYIKTLEQTIASQAKVIEKLREQRDVLIVHAHDDSATKATIQAYRDNLDKAIEQQGEGT